MTIRIGVDPYTTGSQMWVAREKGYFAAHGIDAQITTYATGIETLDATPLAYSTLGITDDQGEASPAETPTATVQRRKGTKQDSLIEMLRAESGATI
jgi:hypothetical protein